jgi:hypothetical protein
LLTRARSVKCKQFLQKPLSGGFLYFNAWVL